jgi:hypothetical protein
MTRRPAWLWIARIGGLIAGGVGYCLIVFNIQDWPAWHYRVAGWIIALLTTSCFYPTRVSVLPLAGLGAYFLSYAIRGPYSGYVLETWWVLCLALIVGLWMLLGALQVLLKWKLLSWNHYVLRRRDLIGAVQSFDETQLNSDKMPRTGLVFYRFGGVFLSIIGLLLVIRSDPFAKNVAGNIGWLLTLLSVYCVRRERLGMIPLALSGLCLIAVPFMGPYDVNSPFTMNWFLGCSVFVGVLCLVGAVQALKNWKTMKWMNFYTVPPQK